MEIKKLKTKEKLNVHIAINLLKKIPTKKTKCPHCGKFMFVRTRPKDNARVVVTKKETDQIDKDRVIVVGTYDSFVAEKEKLEKVKEILRKRFGKEPSENDVKWDILNKNLIEHAKNGDWGLYRNTRFAMAENSKERNEIRTCSANIPRSLLFRFEWSK